MSTRFTLFAVISVLVHAGVLLWSQQQEVQLGLGGEARALRVSVAALTAAAAPSQPAPANAGTDSTTGLDTTNPAPASTEAATTNKPRAMQPTRPPAVHHAASAETASTAHARPPAHTQRRETAPLARHIETTQRVVASAPSTAAQSAPDVSRRISVALRNRLSRYFEYPWLARQRGWEGRVLLSLTVMGNGDLGNWKIVGTSGYRTLDQSALKAARRIDRLPQASAWLNGKSLEVQVPVQYRLLDS